MTTLKYEPDSGAGPDDHWATVWLSMRDASAEIPINYITHPGAHVTRACFANGVYDDLPAQTCISNLFANQFRRLILDLYWDNINQQFNLCPVELPPLVGNSTAGYSVDSPALYSITASSQTYSSQPATAIISSAKAMMDPPGQQRQASTSSAGTTTTTEVNSTSRTTATIGTTSSPTNDVAVPTSTGASGATLLQLGPYLCSLDLNIGSIISLYEDYFDRTSDTISARLHFLDINLHAAAPFTDPAAPGHTPMPGRLPGGDDLIGAQFQSQLMGNLFTPQELQEDRQNLNKSWFRDNYPVLTDTRYFETVETGQDGAISTPDGWPGENWVLLTDGRRLLVSWREIDPQMARYDFRTDSNNVFNASDLISTPAVEWDTSGSVISGCYYHQDDTKVATTNSTWGMAVVNNTDPPMLLNVASNLTSCGLSPILNMTLDGSTAETDVAPYETFAQSAVFGWAPGEPAIASSSKKNNHFRCAVLDSTGSYHGLWRVETCQQSRRAACRILGEPYGWRVSSFTVPFGAAPDACPDNTEFGVPRTGLENTYLYHQVLNTTSGDCNGDCRDIQSGIWINFNSLDEPDCWVITGPNATCPYSDFRAEQQQRNVLIPTIAAIIILILSVLTILVKCNQNRRKGRARRKGANGWEYEGIPS